MKRKLLFISITVVMAMACDVLVTVVPPASPESLPTNTVIPASPIPSAIPASATTLPPTSVPSPTQPVSLGEQVSAGPVSLALLPELAGGIHSSQFPRVDAPDTAMWQRTPGHTQVMLDAYRLQGKSFQPQILVYPALEYAQLVPAAFESMHRLRNILSSPTGSDQLPTVPSFTAAQTFASKIQTLSFQNGEGLRFLTEYAQYPAPVNNTDLFYHFQGFTGDGEYFVIAILPITAPILAETSDPGAPLPIGGVPYPYYAEGVEADMPGYYTAVTALLDATPPEAFTPTIGQLDALIQSMRIQP